LFFGISFHSTAICGERKKSHTSSDAADMRAKLPKLTLYQYKSCPFCSKARAYLDYTGIAYKIVEVNPLFKKEMKFSEYKNVPFLVTGDGTQVRNGLEDVSY
jgi:microsomal prostaglandin-E synthase 2